MGDKSLAYDSTIDNCHFTFHDHLHLPLVIQMQIKLLTDQSGQGRLSLQRPRTEVFLVIRILQRSVLGAKIRARFIVELQCVTRFLGRFAVLGILIEQRELIFGSAIHRSNFYQFFYYFGIHCCQHFGFFMNCTYLFVLTRTFFFSF